MIRHPIYCSRQSGGKSGDCPHKSLVAYFDVPKGVSPGNRLDGYLCGRCAEVEAKRPRPAPVLLIAPELITRLEALKASVGPEGMTADQLMELAAIMKEIMNGPHV